MTAKQAARYAATLLQADDIIAAIDGDAEDSEASALLSCVHLAAAELSTDGFPVIKEETLTAAGVAPVISLSAFGKTPVRIRSVKRGGRAAPFSLDGELHVPSAGEYSVAYEYVPEGGDALEIGAGVSIELVAYAAARNYCLMTGRTDEAGIWDQRYNAEAEKRRLMRSHRLPRRRWEV